jgi:plastocyanin
MLFGSILVACQPEPLATQTSPGIVVGISGDICPAIEVQAGQEVIWTNQDSREHIVRHKPAEGQGQFDSGTLQPGDSFSFTFVQAGSYPYVCSADEVYTGLVTVLQ